MLFFALPLMKRSRYATQISSLRLRSKKGTTWSVLNIRLGLASKTTITAAVAFGGHGPSANKDGRILVTSAMDRLLRVTFPVPALLNRATPSRAAGYRQCSG